MPLRYSKCIVNNKRWLNNECGKPAEYELEFYKLAPEANLERWRFDRQHFVWCHKSRVWQLDEKLVAPLPRVLFAKKYWFSLYQVSPLDGFVKLWRYVCLTLNHLFSYLNKSDGFFKAFRHASVGFAYFWLTEHRASKRAICKTDSVFWCLIGQWKSTIAAKPLKTMFNNNVGKFWNPYKCKDVSRTFISLSLKYISVLSFHRGVNVPQEELWRERWS